MTKEEMNVLAEEIRTRFPALRINASTYAYPNTEKRVFEEVNTIGVWYDNYCVCVLHSRAAFDALVATAHVIVETDERLTQR